MNILAILAASIAAFIIAFLWNGPLFGKLGMRLGNQAQSSGIMPAPKLWQILGNYVVFLVTAAVMAGVFWLVFASPLMGEKTWYRGAIIAAWLWFGFILTSTSIDVIWKGKPWKLWLFEAAASLFVFAAMGAILAAW